MPRAATSLSLSPGILSQCKPDRVFEREMTRDIGSEFELPKTWLCQSSGSFTLIVNEHTAMATTKFLGRFLNLHRRDSIMAERYDTINCTMKMTGMTPSSTSFSAVSCDANLVKTEYGVSGVQCDQKTGRPTQTRRKQLGIEICDEFLVFGVKHAHARDDVARQTNAHDLQHRFEDEEGEVGEVRVRAVRLLLEHGEEAIAA
jgi:hypothetical protein